MKKPCVYFMTNKNHTVIYAGVTSDLTKRVRQHKTKHYKGFTARYNCSHLVYFERLDSMVGAIAREKQLKAGSRMKKEQLISAMNPKWKDLSDGWFD